MANEKLKFPKNLKYTKTHEWLRFEEPNIVTVGITDHAQKQMGDIVWLGLPEVETSVKSEEKIMDIESSKAVSEIYSPADGKIAQINEELREKENLTLINQDPYGKGWLVKIAMESLDASEFMDAKQYQEFIENGEPQ